MDRSCAVCGKGFGAKRAAALYCSERCRKRAQRTGSGTSSGTERVPLLVPEAADLSMLAVARAELQAVGRAGTAAGVAVLALAARIDSAGATETGSAFAALVKEFRASMAAAVAGAEQAADPIDELRAYAERKRSAR